MSLEDEIRALVGVIKTNNQQQTSLLAALSKGIPVAGGGKTSPTTTTTSPTTASSQQAVQNQLNTQLKSSTTATKTALTSATSMADKAAGPGGLIPKVGDIASKVVGGIKGMAGGLINLSDNTGKALNDWTQQYGVYFNRIQEIYGQAQDYVNTGNKTTNNAMKTWENMLVQGVATTNEKLRVEGVGLLGVFENIGQAVATYDQLIDKSQTHIKQVFRDFNYESALSLGLYKKGMGIGVDEIHEFVSRSVSDTGKAGTEMLDRLAKASKIVSKQVGESPKVVAKAAAAMYKQMDKYSTMSVESMAKLAGQIQQIGVRVSDVNSLIGKMQGFDQVTGMVGQLAQLGIQLDAMELFKLANSDDPGAAFRKIREELVAQGKSWEDLSHPMRKALQSAANIQDMEVLQRMMDPTKVHDSMEEINAAFEEAPEETGLKMIKEDIALLPHAVTDTAAEMQRAIKMGLTKGAGREMAQFAKTFGKSQRMVIESTGKMAQGLAPFERLIGVMKKGTFKKMTDSITGFSTAFVGLGDAFGKGKGAGDAFTKLVDAGIQLGKGFGEGFSEAFKAIQDKFGEMLSGFTTQLTTGDKKLNSPPDYLKNTIIKGWEETNKDILKKNLEMLDKMGEADKSKILKGFRDKGSELSKVYDKLKIGQLNLNKLTKSQLKDFEKRYSLGKKELINLQKAKKQVDDMEKKKSSGLTNISDAFELMREFKTELGDKELTKGSLKDLKSMTGLSEAKLKAIYKSTLSEMGGQEKLLKAGFVEDFEKKLDEKFGTGAKSGKIAELQKKYRLDKEQAKKLADANIKNKKREAALARTLAGKSSSGGRRASKDSAAIRSAIQKNTSAIEKLAKSIESGINGKLEFPGKEFAEAIFKGDFGMKPMVDETQ